MKITANILRVDVWSMPVLQVFGVRELAECTGSWSGPGFECKHGQGSGTAYLALLYGLCQRGRHVYDQLTIMNSSLGQTNEPDCIT